MALCSTPYRELTVVQVWAAYNQRLGNFASLGASIPHLNSKHRPARGEQERKRSVTSSHMISTSNCSPAWMGWSITGPFEMGFCTKRRRLENQDSAAFVGES